MSFACMSHGLTSILAGNSVRMRRSSQNWDRREPHFFSEEILSTGKTGWKDSCVDSTMGEMAAYIHGNQGVLAERPAEHETPL